MSVQYKISDIAWASRWDTYLQMSDVQIHWFAICNSVAIVLFLTGECVGAMVDSMSLCRHFGVDIDTYSEEGHSQVQHEGRRDGKYYCLCRGAIMPNRTILWRRRDGSWFTVTSSGHLTTPCCWWRVWARVYSCFAWFSSCWVTTSVVLACVIICVVVVFAMFGMLSPASRGALMTASIVLFMFMG